MRARWLLPFLLSIGCRDYDGDELADVVVEEAWIEDLDYSGMLVVGGGWGGNGTLVVVDPQDERHELPVSLSGGGAGLALNMSLSLGGTDVELKLPRQRIRGNQLLGRYSGSAEALAVLFGAQVHHLRNDEDVQLDFATATFGVSLVVAGQWATLLPREEEPGTGDTGAWTWSDTSEPTDTDTGTGPPEETADTGTPPDDSGTSARPEPTGVTGSTGDTGPLSTSP